MQAFGWKRKAGLNKTQPSLFSEANAEETDDSHDPDVDWLTATKRPKVRFLVLSMTVWKGIEGKIQSVIYLEQRNVFFRSVRSRFSSR